jgi:hypothetical protein
MGSDPQYAKWPLLPLAQHVFTLTNPYANKAAQQSSVKSLQDSIAEHKMAPFYRYLAHPLEGILNAVSEGSSIAPGKPLSRKSSAVGMIATKSPVSSISITWDEGLYQQLKEENDRELEEFQKEEAEAVEKAGDTEIMAARGKRAEFWARVGDKVRYKRPGRAINSTTAACEAAFSDQTPSASLGESNSCLRRRLRKDRRPRHQDRPGTCHHPHGPVLWRQAPGEETRRARQVPGRERW